MRRVLRAACALLALLAAGCSSPSLPELPLVSRGRPYAPVEGLEATSLRARARAAVLGGRGEGPIQVLLLQSGERRDHPFRGDLRALAGPAPDGRFVYAVADDRPGLALRRAGVRGGDEFRLRYRRPISALALAPDARSAAILSPFPAGSAAARGDVLHELVIVDLEIGALRATGRACWNATPAWIDAARVAIVIADEDGARRVAIHDVARSTLEANVVPGERVLADPERGSFMVFERQDGALASARVAPDGVVEAARRHRGALEPLALLGDGLLVAYSSPTLGAEAQWEFDLLGPQVGLATIKLHDLATGAFQTVEPRASPRKLWSAGRLDAAR